MGERGQAGFGYCVSFKVEGYLLTNIEWKEKEEPTVIMD